MVERVSQKALVGSFRKWVEFGSTVYSDQSQMYNWLGFDYTHKSVNHGTGEYVRGDVHTNSIESFWNLYKRAWKGTYTHNLAKNTDRYLAERTFAFNCRELTDYERMATVTACVAGRRLTYTELTA